jgi:choline dehydrogenase-like flavoprotein
MGGIQMLGKTDGEMLRGKAPHWAKFGAMLTPGRSLEMLAHHAVDFWLCGEDLPRPENRITIDREGVVRLAVDGKNNIEGLKRLREKFQSMLSDLGMHDETHERNVYLHQGMDVSATAHQAGTARFGTDPTSSVLDLDCRTHDVDNLYVVDSSFFASIGAVNPTLTIIANSLRVGEQLLDRLK